ncbi:MAG: isoprenylcysteine carboxylmethyltransferase family protein [Rhodospirillales bacterium]|nr:isoprenylcysteine carboxylmethyltransferase family protein [Alphaproteobacteria bacterium]MCB9981543.1 isoprenylcysteine carboxylmethyltransferase family protein [Rhodospirillales bacterium]
MSTKKAVNDTEEPHEIDVEDAPEREAQAPLDHPDLPTSPPIILLLMVMAGIVADWLMPINFGHGWGALGLILLLGALGYAFWCMQLFKTAGTNVNPAMPSSSLVTEGPYKYSRNPIYVCFLIAYVGLAMLADAPVMILLSVGLFFLLDKYIIQPEEEYLEATFGEEYLDYKNTVRRWV